MSIRESVRSWKRSDAGSSEGDRCQGPLDTSPRVRLQVAILTEKDRRANNRSVRVCGLAALTAAVVVSAIGSPAATAALPTKQKRAPLDGLLLRFSGDKITEMKGQTGVCGNVPKVKYFTVRSTSFEVLRDPTGKAAVTPDAKSIGAFGMDVNVENQAYTWGAGLIFGVNGRRAKLIFNQTDPSSPLNCSTRPRPRAYTTALPGSVWLGRRYYGAAWMRVTIAADRSSWTVLLSFGARPSFSTG